MKYTDYKKVTRNGLLVLSLALATALPVAAQANNRNDRNDRNDNTTRVVEKDDTDWGWAGLLGLLGLAGLIPRKRKVEVQEFRDPRTTQSDQTGSSTGTTR